MSYSKYFRFSSDFANNSLNQSPPEPSSPPIDSVVSWILNAILKVVGRILNALVEVVTSF